MFSKKNNSQIKRLLSFIIICFFKNTSTIQSFREVKRRDRFILRDFHYIFQDFIVARQKDFEFDSDYNLFFKLFSSIILSQFFRKFTFDFSSDTNLFDLKARESSSISFKQSLSSFHHVRRRYQNDLSVRDNAIERFFRVSNMTERNEKSINFYESLTLRRDRTSNNSNQSIKLQSSRSQSFQSFSRSFAKSK
jgi:hypothetical protein